MNLMAVAQGAGEAVGAQILVEEEVDGCLNKWRGARGAHKDRGAPRG